MFLAKYGVFWFVFFRIRSEYGKKQTIKYFSFEYFLHSGLHNIFFCKIGIIRIADFCSAKIAYEIIGYNKLNFFPNLRDFLEILRGSK